MVAAGVVVMPRGILGSADAIDFGRALLAGACTVAVLKAAAGHLSGARDPGSASRLHARERRRRTVALERPRPVRRVLGLSR